ncbi:Tex family protein [Salegentibacter sp. HM20]
MQVLEYIETRLKLPRQAIKNSIDLFNQDASIPFIARYRKEQTGNLDEVSLEQILNLQKSFQELESRRGRLLQVLEEQDNLSSELKEKLQKANSLTELEDLYLPFKKKRQTRAEVARKAGLEPLAKMIMAQNLSEPASLVSRFRSENFTSEEEVFKGARDIIAEWINENTFIRSRLRKLYSREALIKTKAGKNTEAELDKYSAYLKIEEALHRIPSHRFLAIYRASNEDILQLNIKVDKDRALGIILKALLKNNPASFCEEQIQLAAADAFSRLLKPSFSTEFLSSAKEKADREAIEVFASNLEQLLMAPPLGPKRILAIDPGFKSGCKVVCLDAQANLLHNENIYPHPPQKQMEKSAAKIRNLVNAYQIEAIAIGNGTAARETENFIKKSGLPSSVQVYMVNEAGASVYSASQTAREKFPNYDITVRGAVSIGRRLMDPLAELVKIDPKSIGVGQYQHEVDQKLLKEKLDIVVSRCVNLVGVNVNTASSELLAYVSGLGPALASNIIAFRKENGALKSRQDLLKVKRLGAKAYEQAAGFIRIKNAENPLDDSAVHPESYFIVEQIANDLGVKPKDLIGNKELLQNIVPENYTSAEAGLPTIKDILNELEKPGLDPRAGLKAFAFDPSVKTIEDLKPGMLLPGIINNITNFGCFVDIGIKQSGLVHISKLAKQFVSDVNSVVKLNQQVEVRVLEIDLEKGRIQLSLID